MSTTPRVKRSKPARPDIVPALDFSRVPLDTPSPARAKPANGADAKAPQTSNHHGPIPATGAKVGKRPANSSSMGGAETPRVARPAVVDAPASSSSAGSLTVPLVIVAVLVAVGGIWWSQQQQQQQTVPVTTGSKASSLGASAGDAIKTASASASTQASPGAAASTASTTGAKSQVGACLNKPL